MTFAGLAALLTLALAPPEPAAACAATPQDAWKNARAAVAGKDAGAVMLTLTPDYRTRNSVEYAVGASMVAELGGLAGEMSSSPGAAAKAKAAEKKLLAELDGILTKHKALTIREIGTPRLMKMRDRDVQAGFAKIDHASYAREMEAFFVRVEAAAKAAGVSSEGPPKLDELVVGGGDLNAPLAAPAVTGDTAHAKAGELAIFFRKVDGCWLIDGRED